MKLLLLQLAAVSSAFILPNEQVSSLRHVQVESSRAAKSAADCLPSKSEVQNDVEAAFGHVSDEFERAVERIFYEVEQGLVQSSTKSKTFLDETLDAVEDAGFEARDKFDEYSANTKHFLDDARDAAQDAGSHAKATIQDTYHDAHSWAESQLDDLDADNIFGHHGGHHHHKPNETVYQLISKRKYFSKITKLINEYDDLVEILNGTAANYTVFAPVDDAFKKLPKDHKPSKKVLFDILSYHVSPEFYPVSGILGARTIPTLYKSKSLGKDPLPQRLSTNIGWRGLTINYMTRVVGANLFGTNGVIHGVNSLLLPPPIAVEVIDLVPSELSTLELGLLKTGLFDQLNTTKHSGGTLFAPDNNAFAKLGHKINAFLFSQYGRKYLKALLEYHTVPFNTLYSDAFYKKSSDEVTTVPKGTFHVDLPTLLEDRSLSIDIARFGRLIEIKINAFARVAASDAVCADGVIHILGDVLVPPKKLDSGEMQLWTGAEELTVEDLKERLEPFVVNDWHQEEL